MDLKREPMGLRDKSHHNGFMCCDEQGSISVGACRVLCKMGAAGKRYLLCSVRRALQRGLEDLLKLFPIMQMDAFLRHGYCWQLVGWSLLADSLGSFPFFNFPALQHC